MRYALASLLILMGVVFPLEAQENTEDDVIEIEILWFDDGSESQTLTALLDVFMEQNPGVNVDLEVNSARETNRRLQERLNALDMPDLARSNIPGGFRDELLDLRPYLEDPEAWEQNFRDDFLAGLRADPTTDGLYGYPTDITISAPYINRSLWERAGVPIPSYVKDNPTWEDWIVGATEVQAALTNNRNDIYAIGIDATGHRFWGPSLSRCASYVQGFGTPTEQVTIDTAGFRDTAEMLRQWHRNELIPSDIWLGDMDGDPPERMFIDGKLAFYFSGNWHLNNFQNRINDFEWEVVPNPTGDCGKTGMVGGSVMIAFEQTEHPEVVGDLVDFLTQYDNLRQFYTENLILPGHTGMIQETLYPSGSADLRRFQQELANAKEEAFVLQYRPDSFLLHSNIRDGLQTMLVEDLTLDETVSLIEQEIGIIPAAPDDEPAG